VFLDLAKAFAWADHTILLQTLVSYGFSESAHSWLRSFLNNKTQQVTYGGCLSSSGFIKVEVPQGSILGPLFFFSIYVNDLPNVISSYDINKYADDTGLHFLFYLFIITGQAAQLISPGKKIITRICMEVISYNDLIYSNVIIY